MVSVKKRAKAKYSRTGKPNLSTMNHRELGAYIADAMVKCQIVPTIQHVRNIMGEAVLEQDHIKFLAARVTMFNISKMGDL